MKSVLKSSRTIRNSVTEVIPDACEGVGVEADAEVSEDAGVSEAAAT